MWKREIDVRIVFPEMMAMVALSVNNGNGRCRNKECEDDAVLSLNS